MTNKIMYIKTILGGIYLFICFVIFMLKTKQNKKLAANMASQMY